MGGGGGVEGGAGGGGRRVGEVPIRNTLTHVCMLVVEKKRETVVFVCE